MSSFLQSVDERTKLAGTNKLEMLMFSLGKNKETGKEDKIKVVPIGNTQVIQVEVHQKWLLSLYQQILSFSAQGYSKHDPENDEEG